MLPESAPTLVAPGQQTADACRWLSRHLHFDGDIYGATADRLLLDTIEPVVARCLDAGWARRFFFIRYRDANGPHLRLRLWGPTDDLERYAEPLIEDAGFARTEQVDYQPETSRYGGSAAALTIAERHFHDSSLSAFELLAKLPSAANDDAAIRASRLGKALLAQTVMLHVMTGGDRLAAGELIHYYGGSYLRLQVPDERQRRSWSQIFSAGVTQQASTLGAHVDAVWRAIDADLPLTTELDRYAARLARLRRELEAAMSAGALLGPHGLLDTWVDVARTLIPSFLHMTNNRLGVAIRDECYLAAAAAATLTPDLDPALAPDLDPVLQPIDQPQEAE